MPYREREACTSELSIPLWQQGHHWLIYFSLTILLLAPLIAGGAALAHSGARRTLAEAGAALLLLGVVLVNLTCATTQFAEGVLTGASARTLLDRCLEFGRLARESLGLAVLLLALYLLIRRLFRLRSREVTGVLPLSAALFYALGIMWLIHIAYYGEMLAHEFGVGG